MTSLIIPIESSIGINLERFYYCNNYSYLFPCSPETQGHHDGDSNLPVEGPAEMVPIDSSHVDKPPGDIDSSASFMAGNQYKHFLCIDLIT